MRMSFEYGRWSTLILSLAETGCLLGLAQCGSSSSSSPGNPTEDAGAGDAGRHPDAGGGVDAHADAAPARTCDGAHPCPGPTTEACCSGVCVDTAADPKNCGRCGVACTAHQFCTGVQCDDAVVANVCDNPSATVVLDQYPADNDGGAAIGAALAANCIPATTIVQKDQAAGGVIELPTGRPITGVGNTFVTGGGQYGQKGIGYLDMNGISPLYPAVTGNEYDLFERATGKKLLMTSLPALTAHHDFFYVQTAVEPASGTLCFSGIGLGQGPGTVAAGYYLSSEIIPNRMKYTAAWYLYEWTDTNNDSTPNQGDTFMQLGSGM